jgi:hypothetical protein
LEIIFDVDAHACLFQIADMAKAAVDPEIASKDLLDGLRFRGALNY